MLTPTNFQNALTALNASPLLMVLPDIRALALKRNTGSPGAGTVIVTRKNGVCVDVVLGLHAPDPQQMSPYFPHDGKTVIHFSESGGWKQTEDDDDTLWDEFITTKSFEVALDEALVIAAALITLQEDTIFVERHQGLWVKTLDRPGAVIWTPGQPHPDSRKLVSLNPQGERYGKAHRTGRFEGEQEDVHLLSWYTDELTMGFCEHELLGLTRDGVSQLFLRRDVAYLQR